MYCIKCGVELADAEKQCPLCGTVVFHPELTRPAGEKLYPPDLYPPKKMRPLAVLVAVSMLFLLPMFISVLCDVQLNGGITWAGYVIGGLAVGYVGLVLPFWFRRPNPVIFVPVTFAAVCLFLLYINLATGGSWFLSFAFPVTGGAALIVTTLVTLTRYIHRGRFFIYGGTCIATGIFAVVIELLLNLTFGQALRLVWSPYPLIVLALLGITLLLIASFRPLRESLGKRFFI